VNRLAQSSLIGSDRSDPIDLERMTLTTWT
jgi:hypothetical protein